MHRARVYVLDITKKRIGLVSPTPIMYDQVWNDVLVDRYIPFAYCFSLAFFDQEVSSV